jgi:hypothetical protein
MRMGMSQGKGVSKGGWVNVKGKRRWMSLKEGLIIWYESEPVEGASQRAKVDGNLYLLECTISRDDFGFTIRTSYGKTFPVTTHTVRCWDVLR